MHSIRQEMFRKLHFFVTLMSMSNSFLRIWFTTERAPACQSCFSRVYGVLFASLFLRRTLGGTSVTITCLAPLASSVFRTSRMFVATIVGKSTQLSHCPLCAEQRCPDANLLLVPLKISVSHHHGQSESVCLC